MRWWNNYLNHSWLSSIAHFWSNSIHILNFELFTWFFDMVLSGHEHESQSMWNNQILDGRLWKLICEYSLHRIKFKLLDENPRSYFFKNWNIMVQTSEFWCNRNWNINKLKREDTRSMCWYVWKWFNMQWF